MGPAPLFLSPEDGVQPSLLAYMIVISDCLTDWTYARPYLAIDELDVLGTLRVTVPSAIRSSSLVRSGEATIARHLGEVQGTIDTTRKSRDVNIKGELLVEQIEQLVVLALDTQHVQTRADIATRLERHGQSVTIGCYAICARVVRTIESTVLGTGGAVWAQGLVPSLASVAVVRAGCAVNPAPIGVQDDTVLLFGAARCSAVRQRERWMGLLGKSADLLSQSASAQADDGSFDG